MQKIRTLVFVALFLTVAGSSFAETNYQAIFRRHPSPYDGYSSERWNFSVLRDERDKNKFLVPVDYSNLWVESRVVYYYENVYRQYIDHRGVTRINHSRRMVTHWLSDRTVDSNVFRNGKEYAVYRVVWTAR